MGIQIDEFITCISSASIEDGLRGTGKPIASRQFLERGDHLRFPCSSRSKENEKLLCFIRPKQSIAHRLLKCSYQFSIPTEDSVDKLFPCGACRGWVIHNPRLIAE